MPNDIFPIILYILASILLIVLIILTIKVMKTLTKVDAAIDDYNEKSRKLNGIFDLIDGATDTISTLSDRFIGVIINGITRLFKKKGKEEKTDE